VSFGRLAPLGAVAKRAVTERLLGTLYRLESPPPPRTGKPDEQDCSYSGLDDPFEAVVVQQRAHGQEEQEQDPEQSDGGWKFVDGYSLAVAVEW
jgi:hypothetical protein